MFRLIGIWPVQSLSIVVILNFLIFVIRFLSFFNVLEYYRILFGKIHPLGLARVLHFEVLCRALGYDSSLLSFRRFFRLAKNGDWYTFETTQVDT